MDISQDNLYRFERCQLEDLRVGDLFFCEESESPHIVLGHKLTTTACWDTSGKTCEYFPTKEVWLVTGRFNVTPVFGGSSSLAS